MSLYKRGHIWWAYFYIDGVRHQESTGTSNRRDALRIEEQLQRDANLKKHALPTLDPDMTFGALVARFIAAGESRSHHRDRFTALLSYFADIAIGHLAKPMVREYRQARLAAKPITDATVNRDVSVLRHLLYWAVDEGLLEANPLTRIRLVRERPTPRPVVRIDEECKLLQAAPPYLRELIALALDTGMRRGELLHQRLEHVDLPRQLLAVTHSKTAGGEGREIPLTTRVYTVLKSRASTNGLVFLYRDQQLRNVKKSWHGTLKRAAIRHVRFHDLRHTFNTRLLELGVLQEVRKALMGHSSGSNVHARYTHIELPLKREAIARLDTWHQAQVANMPGLVNGTSKEEMHDGSENRTQGGANAQAMEEEDALGSGRGADGEAARGDR
jgi:integrase